VHIVNEGSEMLKSASEIEMKQIHEKSGPRRRHSQSSVVIPNEHVSKKNKSIREQSHKSKPLPGVSMTQKTTTTIEKHTARQIPRCVTDVHLTIDPVTNQEPLSPCLVFEIEKFGTVEGVEQLEPFPDISISISHIPSASDSSTKQSSGLSANSSVSSKETVLSHGVCQSELQGWKINWDPTHTRRLVVTLGKVVHKDKGSQESKGSQGKKGGGKELQNSHRLRFSVADKDKTWSAEIKVNVVIRDKKPWCSLL